MKKILIILFLCSSLLSYSQSIPVPPISFGTLTDMRLQAGTANTQISLNGLNTINDKNGGLYMWDAASTATDDGFITIQVTGVSTGRWLRLANANTFKGSNLLSGVALQTAYTVNYPATLTYTPLTVIVIPRSANAAVPSWVSTITNTGFVVNFTSIPVVGTNNISIDWIVVKQ